MGDGERREAAVLVPVFADRNRGPTIVLVQRGEHGVYGSQLAFPGGKLDPEDASARDAALREAHEEVGLEPGAVEVLADLPMIETFTTGFRVWPFLGRVTRPEEWRPEEREIVEVVEAPLSDLDRPGAHAEEVMDFPTWPEPRLTPFYRVGDYRLWGVTYRILHPLLPRLLAAEWEI